MQFPMCSLKTAILKEWNKISEEFILKGYKSFRWSVDKIIENGDILSVFYVYLFISSVIFKIKVYILS